MLKCSLFADSANISLSYRNNTERNILQSGPSELYNWTLKWNVQIAFKKVDFISDMYDVNCTSIT